MATRLVDASARNALFILTKGRLRAPFLSATGPLGAGALASEAKDPKSGLPYIFGWLGGWDPATGPNSNHYRAVREGGVFKYRFPVSKTSTGSARVEFTTDLRFPVPANSWSVRGLRQKVVPGNLPYGDHAVIEVTAPSPTQGFFRLIYSP